MKKFTDLTSQGFCSMALLAEFLAKSHEGVKANALLQMADTFRKISAAKAAECVMNSLRARSPAMRLSAGIQAAGAVAVVLPIDPSAEDWDNSGDVIEWLLAEVQENPLELPDEQLIRNRNICRDVLELALKQCRGEESRPA